MLSLWERFANVLAGTAEQGSYMQEVFRPYVGKCDFNVGTMFAHDAFAFLLHDACVSEDIDFPFDYVFGSVPCALQGGRAAPYTFDQDEIADIFNTYADMGVGCRLTFSNSNVTPEDLADEQSNFLLAYLNEGKNNGAIVTSDLLADFIRDAYPNLQLISSLVKPTVENILGQETAEYYNDLLERFDIVVVNSAFAYDDDFLSQINHKDKVEFICNHRCRPNCPRSKEHYITQTNAARAATTGDAVAQQKLEDKLRSINDWCLSERQKNPCVNSLISTQRMQELIDAGFKHFKIEGRDYPIYCIVRDVGNWIFEPEGIFLSMAQSFLNTPI